MLNWILRVCAFVKGFAVAILMILGACFVVVTASDNAGFFRKRIKDDGTEEWIKF